MSIKATLPSKEEVENSTVFQKVGTSCNKAYWTSTPSVFIDASCAHEVYVNSSGTFDSWSVKQFYGIRPVLKFDDLESKEILKKLKIKFGIQVIKIGGFPHMLENVEIDDTSVLEETGNKYILPEENNSKTTLERLTEYDYKGQKVVKKGNSYYPVKPIEWDNDEENNMLISKDVLFEAPINVDNPNYDGSFETSQLYNYLNNEFIKQLASSMEQFKLEVEEEKSNPYGLDLEMVDEEDIIEGAIESDIPVMLHGKTGDGKSARVKQIDPNAQIIYLADADPTDINGKSVQNPSLDHLVDYPPTWYEKAKKIAEESPDKIHIIFFDEITNADPLIQGMVFNIVLDKEVNGKWKLPENIRIVAAGNEEEESLSAHELSAPLFSRFAHVKIQTNREKWLKWASSKVDKEGNSIIHPAIYAYIAYKGDEVLRTKYNGETPNADPRKWEMASKLLNKTGKVDMLRALIGPELTYDFKCFITQKVITLEDVLNDNYDNIEMDISSKYATVSGLVRVDEENVEKVRDFVNTLGPEFLSTFDALWTAGNMERLELIASLRKEKEI